MLPPLVSDVLLLVFALGIIAQVAVDRDRPVGRQVPGVLYQRAAFVAAYDLPELPVLLSGRALDLPRVLLFLLEESLAPTLLLFPLEAFFLLPLEQISALFFLLLLADSFLLLALALFFLSLEDLALALLFFLFPASPFLLFEAPPILLLDPPFLLLPPQLLLAELLLPHQLGLALALWVLAPLLRLPVVPLLFVVDPVCFGA